MKKEQMIVDGCWSISGTDDLLIEQEGEYFLLPWNWKDDEKARTRKVASVQWAKAKIENGYAVNDYMYIMLGIEKRSGYNVEIGRPITTEEFEEIKTRFNLTTDDITKPFEDKRGAIFGEKWEKKFTSVQIAVDPIDALSLETKLKEKGIEAANGAAGRINIRVE